MVTIEKEAKTKKKSESILLPHLFFLELFGQQVVSLSQAYRIY